MKIYLILTIVRTARISQNPQVEKALMEMLRGSTGYKLL